MNRRDVKDAEQRTSLMEEGTLLRVTLHLATKDVPAWPGSHLLEELHVQEPGRSASKRPDYVAKGSKSDAR